MTLWDKKKDTVCLIMLALVTFVGIYILFDFGKFGLDTPFSYSGGDDNFFLAQIKWVGEYPWIWCTNDQLGAPFGADSYAFTISYLMNLDFLLSKIIYFFADDPVITLNILRILFFSLSAASAFIVLRVLRVTRIFSVLGAVLFALTPYLFARSVGHQNLACCYMVPISILLCAWSHDEKRDWLIFKRGFWKNRRNWIALILTICIANNGTGYYPYFTCFFLVVTAIYNVIRYRKILSAAAPMKLVGLILFFFILAVAPAYVMSIRAGESIMPARGINDVEIYGLKIIQMFLPLDSHGITKLQELIDKYNTTTAYYNENATAYLGIAGIAGLFILLIWLFVSDKKGDSWKRQNTALFSKLTICAILLATTGGFSAIIGYFLSFNSIRAYNRISIYISFMAIAALMICFDSCMKKLFQKTGRVYVKTGLIVLLAAFVALSLYDLLPEYGKYDAAMQQNRSLCENDRSFTQTIEAQLEPGDMVYQLPYNGYPVVTIPGMYYELLNPYLYSNTLKWSYGNISGTQKDNWNKYIASLETEDMLNAIIASGFKGLYIDARGYSAEQLTALIGEIEEILGYQPSISENQLLRFYNLYPYIEKNPQLLEQQPIDLEEANLLITGDIEQMVAAGYFTEGQTLIVQNEFQLQDAGEYLIFELPITLSEDVYYKIEFELESTFNFDLTSSFFVDLFGGADYDFAEQERGDFLVDGQYQYTLYINSGKLGADTLEAFVRVVDFTTKKEPVTIKNFKVTEMIPNFG